MRLGTSIVPSQGRVAAFAGALLALVGLASGCDDASAMEAETGTTGMDEVPVDDGLLELGWFAESRRFVPYAVGTEEEVELGLQGGYHIFVDGRLRPDADLDEVVVQLSVTLLSDGSEVTQIRHQRTPDIPDADGWPTLPEMIIFIPDPAVVEDQDVRVDVRLEAIDGTLLDVLDAELHLHGEG